MSKREEEIKHLIDIDIRTDLTLSAWRALRECYAPQLTYVRANIDQQIGILESMKAEARTMLDDVRLGADRETAIEHASEASKQTSKNS